MASTNGSVEYDIKKSLHYAAMKKADLVCKHIHEYSLQHYVGDVTGLSILDFGCGHGYHSRLMKQKGAARVIGIDISKDQIELCMKKEREHPLGITYKIMDGQALSKIGEFDLVLANNVLMYAQTMEDLADMINSISVNLKPGGQYIGVNFDTSTNAWHNALVKYGRSFKKLYDIPGGIAGRIYWNVPGFTEFSAIHYYYDRSVYKKLFSLAGFQTLKFEKVLNDKLSQHEFPQGYWDDYFKHPNLVVLMAKKLL